MDSTATSTSGDVSATLNFRDGSESAFQLSRVTLRSPSKAVLAALQALQQRLRTVEAEAAIAQADATSLRTGLLAEQQQTVRLRAALAAQEERNAVNASAALEASSLSARQEETQRQLAQAREEVLRLREAAADDRAARTRQEQEAAASVQHLRESNRVLQVALDAERDRAEQLLVALEKSQRAAADSAAQLRAVEHRAARAEEALDHTRRVMADRQQQWHEEASASSRQYRQDLQAVTERLSRQHAAKQERLAEEVTLLRSQLLETAETVEREPRSSAAVYAGEGGVAEESASAALHVSHLTAAAPPLPPAAPTVRAGSPAAAESSGAAAAALTAAYGGPLPFLASSSQASHSAIARAQAAVASSSVPAAATPPPVSEYRSRFIGSSPADGYTTTPRGRPGVLFHVVRHTASAHLKELAAPPWR